LYYGHYNIDGKYLGFYTSEIHCRLVPIYNTESIEEIQEESLEQEDGTVHVGEEWDLSAIPTPHIELIEQEWREALTATTRSLMANTPIVHRLNRQRRRLSMAIARRCFICGEKNG